MKRSYEIDMCNGPLLGKILQFSIPLICSGILQLLFNAADIVVVGQFTGSDALAAVGSTSALNNLIVNVFLGFSIGCSIMTARYYGAQKWKDVHEVVHTSMLVSMICGAALIVIGIALARPLLEVMGTPENVLDQAVLYMRIIFVGMPALMVYNFGAAILRAVGDTKRPLLFLLIIFGVVKTFTIVPPGEVFSAPPVAPISFASAISLMVGSFIVGVSIVQDFTRYSKTAKDSTVGIILGFTIGYPAVVICGAIFTCAFQTNDLTDVLINVLGFSYVAAFIIVVATWTTNHNNIYQSVLGLTNACHGIVKLPR